MNHYVPATHLRVVGADPVHVLASLTKKQRKRLCADHLTKRRKVLVQQVNVHRPLNRLGESALALATNQQKSMPKNMGEGSDEEDKLLTIAS